jgi:hypothetical protein
VHLGFWVFWESWEVLVLFEAGSEVLAGLCVGEVLCRKGQYMNIQGKGVFCAWL